MHNVQTVCSQPDNAHGECAECLWLWFLAGVTVVAIVTTMVTNDITSQ